ncbi:MAG: twin-arginine translocation signal domain-containing protein, partial [Actinobacteria bacterium]|nr:twin-arginine translocation signal domain-containing protein [Actinomycetota bacterium]
MQGAGWPGASSGDEREQREQRDGISRRDFLDGVAVTAAGLALAATAPGLSGGQAAAAATRENVGGSAGLPPDYYPPG